MNKSSKHLNWIIVIQNNWTFGFYVRKVNLNYSTFVVVLTVRFTLFFCSSYSAVLWNLWNLKLLLIFSIFFGPSDSLIYFLHMLLWCWWCCYFWLFICTHFIPYWISNIARQSTLLRLLIRIEILKSVTSFTYCDNTFKIMVTYFHNAFFI